MAEQLWHNLPINEIFKELKASRSGLSINEVSQRQKKFGLNQLPTEKSLSRLKILLIQFKSPLVYVLLGAAIIAISLGDISDMVIILIAILVNVILGYYQENKANKAITHLRRLVEFKTKVLRDEKKINLNSKYLVPGDIIFVRPGDRIPADARLLIAENLQITEAALTGESVPSTKNSKSLNRGAILADRENMVYAGTIVASGNGQAIVCETGSHTEIGKITKLIKETAEEPTPLQQQISQLGKFLTFLVIGISAVILLIGWLQGRPIITFGPGAKESMLLVAAAVAVSAIPEGLLIAVTVILSVGMQAILRRKSLVRRLVAAETLGSVSIICTDKTGTLTEGKMIIERIITYNEDIFIKHPAAYQSTEILKDHDLITKISLLCGNATIENPESIMEEWRVIGDPTEQALTVSALQRGITKEKLEQDQPRILELPFDSQTKYMATLNHLNDKQNVIYVKGAPEKILSMVGQLRINSKKEKLTAARIKALTDKYEKLTAQGLRLLAFAYKKIDRDKKVINLADELQDLIFVGFVALKDPLRPEAKATFKIVRQAGIRPIIVTGDHKLTAKAIVIELGIKISDKNILSGTQLDEMTDEELGRIINKIDIYARVEPRHKLRIIAAWQKKGEIVAMTGDGINDAPALKAADIGIALGSGTDVAKETADMILLDNNFTTIVAAIKQGRIIFDNIRKVILYLLSDSFSEVILIVGALILKLPLPILPAQILWVNIIDDTFPALALTAEKEERGIMLNKPRIKSEPLLNKEIKILISTIGVVMNISLLTLFYILLKLGYNIDHARTFIFTAVGLDSLLYVFSCRTLRQSIFNKNIFSNRYLVLAVIAGLLLQALAIYQPQLQRFFSTVSLNLTDWILLAGMGIIQLLIIETIKHYFIVHPQLQYE